MSLSTNVKIKIKNMLVETVSTKLENYNPETSYMPFHFNLIGKDIYALFSFIQSINTTFGTSIWEQLGVLLATDKGKQAIRQYKLPGSIDQQTESLIIGHVNQLRQGSITPDKVNEKNNIKNSIKPGNNTITDPDRVVDLFVKNPDNSEEYYDITSAKPNMKEFATLKTKLLRWAALRYSIDKGISLETRLGIPYNPYYPKPYERWTLKGLYDLKYEVLVGVDLWNHLYDEDIYDELLEVFKDAGNKLRPLIENRFKEFRN